mmetsp:Transcript_30870/g.99604  ORF Transcript_30870/g.99604 Transcript_30870/m.99604 type:complete len:238 (+) Transcript_30870:1454-2167(+)
MTAAIVAPFLASARKTLTTCRLVAESSPDVGSSANMQQGSATSSRATLTRFRWPPEMPRFSTEPTTECRTALSPSAATTSRTSRDRECLDVGSRIADANSRISVTESSRVMTSSWGTKAVKGAMVLREIDGSPFTRIFVSGLGTSFPLCNRDVHTLRRLDLPAPDGPRIAVALSALKAQVTLSRTRNGRPFDDATTDSPSWSNSMSTRSPRLFTGSDRRSRFSSRFNCDDPLLSALS